MPPPIGVRIDGDATKTASTPFDPLGRRPRRGTRCAVAPGSLPGRVEQASDVVEHPRVRARRLVGRGIQRLADQHPAAAARRAVHDDLRRTVRAHPAGSGSAAPRRVPVRASSCQSSSAVSRPLLLLDDQPALHLEMQRRAELGAVEAVGARLVGDELDRRASRRDRGSPSRSSIGTAKPCVASAVCSAFVRCTITLSPTLAVTMSGVKWLRTTFIQTSTTPGRRTMRASFSLAMRVGALQVGRRRTMPGP